MIDPFKTDLEQAKQTVKRFSLARTAIVLVVAVLCVAIQSSGNAETDPSMAYLWAIFGIALIESVVVIVIISAGHIPTLRLSFFLLAADFVFISAIIVMTGGSKSIFAFLYIAAILSTAILLPFRWSIIMASASSAMFLLITVLEYNGYLRTAAAFGWREPAMDASEIFAYTGMKVFGFYLTAFLGGYLARRVGLLETFQQNILSSLTSGFIGVNRDSVVTFLNPAGSAILNRPQSEAVSKHVSSVFQVADRQPNPLEESTTKGRECQSREITVTRGDGKSIPVGITVSPLLNGAKKLMGAVGSFIDLTQLKRMEDRLRRADRLAAIGEMSASLAHEIRNPVASIRAAVQELADNLILEDTNGQLMKIALRECDQLNKIVTGFLEFAGTSLREKGRFNISGLLDEVVQLAEKCILNGSASIIREYRKDLGYVTGDRSQIKEAVLNVIQNGKEAMQTGGRLRINATSDDVESGMLNISIEDNGRGLSPEEIEKIFDPFYTTKPGGTGLGMAIVHKIITSHGGSIDVVSNVGNGTKVTITLPMRN